jgi:predicted transcriptional regulator
MSSDDTPDDGDAGEGADGGTPREELRRTRERIGEGADRALEGFDRSVVDLLSWLLDTETRARIYVYLRQSPDATSEEVADGTGLYPSTVREALAELHDEGIVDRRKRESAGAGNNPYEYEAIAPSELVRGAVGQVQEELNAVFTLDSRLGGDEPADDEPITISVDDRESPAADGEPGPDPHDGESESDSRDRDPETDPGNGDSESEDGDR